MKIIVSMLVGIAFAFAAIELIGFAAAIPAPAWSRWASHPKTWLLLDQFADIATPVFALGVLFGAALGRVIKSNSVAFGLIAALPYLAHAAWEEWTGPAAIFSTLWFLALPVVIAVIAGLCLGISRFGKPAKPGAATSALAQA